MNMHGPPPKPMPGHPSHTRLTDDQIAELRSSVFSLGLSTRTESILFREKVQDVEGILSCDPEAVLKWKGTGPIALAEINQALARIGFPGGVGMPIEVLRDARLRQQARF